ncbi:MAG: hypothetical protein WC554_17280 [Clostridia bacterium]
MQVSFTTNSIRHKIIDGLLVVKPTKEDIDNLKVGDFAPNCFGKFGKVKSITYRGIDVNGKAYVGYYVEWHGENSSISESLKEDDLLITVPLSCKYSAIELDNISKLI